SDRYVELYYALPWVGAVAVPINTRLAPAEVRAILEDAECETLVVDEVSLPGLETALGAAKVRLAFVGEGEPPTGMVGYETLAEAPPIDDVGRGGEDLYGIFYTGGTTGRSKGVMLSHRNILANQENVAGLADVSGWSDPVYLHAAPMFHLADLGSTFHVTAIGGTHAVVSRFDPGDVLRAIAEYRVTATMLVPTMINMLLQFPGLDRYDVSCLQFMTYGASPMPPAVMARAFEVFPGIQFMQGYGMTELSPMATFLDAAYHVVDGPRAGKLRSAGRAVGTAEVRVVDEHDRPVPTGTIGEVVVRGPMVMQGYWKQPELTARTIRDGWLHTGDAGYLDEDGFLFIVDRVKDMIISGGENVYSVEVEAALYAHSAVAMCAVFGIPDDRWGEAVHAVVVPRPGQAVTEAELIEFCRARIAGYKCPRGVSFQDTALPISGAGKILKNELRAPYWDGRARRVN
ncbi:MAG: AMP-binding protein, partial [Gemmatimonadales bacterium]|nr:AMP-binding protein [Gemmatimonadales bacterium]